MIKIKDLRIGEDTELGNTIEVSGDHSMLFITTDKGFRLIMDTYNMKKIADHYKDTAPPSKKQKTEVKE